MPDVFAVIPSAKTHDQDALSSKTHSIQREGSHDPGQGRRLVANRAQDSSSETHGRNGTRSSENHRDMGLGPEINAIIQYRPRIYQSTLLVKLIFGNNDNNDS